MVARYILADVWRQIWREDQIALAGRIALQFYQQLLVLQLGGLNFLKHVICHKQIITRKEPDIVFYSLVFNNIPLTH